MVEESAISHFSSFLFWYLPWFSLFIILPSFFCPWFLVLFPRCLTACCIYRTMWLCLTGRMGCCDYVNSVWWQSEEEREKRYKSVATTDLVRTTRVVKHGRHVRTLAGERPWHFELLLRLEAAIDSLCDSLLEGRICKRRLWTWLAGWKKQRHDGRAALHTEGH